MPRVPVFTFHALDRRGDLIAFSPDVFAAAMDRLARLGGTSLRMGDLAGRLGAGLPLPARPFALTFDDGYESVFEHALPVLQRHGFVATAFLSVGEGDSREGDCLPSLEGRPMLSWEQIQVLRDHGWELGAHGCRHEPLVGRPVAEVAADAGRSRCLIEERTGERVRGFSYPFGRFDRSVRGAVQGAGFDYAVSDRMGRATGHSDPYALERIETFYFRSARRFTLATGPGQGLLLGLLRGTRAVRRVVRP